MSKGIEYINTKYDIDESHSAKIELDFEQDDSKLTVIAGGSGTGKSTILRNWFQDIQLEPNYVNEKSIFDVLTHGDDYEETSQLLFDVGLSSVPVWKNKFSQLSNGEKFRFDVAYKLKFSDVVIVDEFTSMLDRQTAQNITTNINRLLDKYDKRMIVATAHFDVLDWMKVDRLIDTNLKKQSSLQELTLITHKHWRYEVFQEICGDYLTTIII